MSGFRLGTLFVYVRSAFHYFRLKGCARGCDRGRKTSVYSKSLSFESGFMWDQVRSIDWSQTSLGSRDDWPRSLVATLRMVLSSKQTICFWWGPELLQFHNEAYLPLLGERVHGAIGKPFQELWPDVAADVMPYLEKALSGEGTWTENLPLIMTRSGYPEQTYWSFSYSPLYDDGGKISGVLNITTETTKYVLASQARQTENDELSEALDDAQETIAEQREKDRTRRLIQRELSHRLKNLFAMVNAIVNQSMRMDAPIEEIRTSISSRIRALSNAQDLLVNSQDGTATIQDVIEATLLPHQNHQRQVAISGPEIVVATQQGMGIALAVHELATNAAKYGALSVPGGMVEVAWSSDGKSFRFDWREKGGPVPTSTSQKGFGTRILQRIVPGYFEGSASAEYSSSGFVYTLDGTIAADDDYVS